MTRIANKIALVTGASTGIGRAITQRFIAEGATVVAIARRQDKLDALAREIPGNLHTLACDVSREEDVAKVVSYCREHFGRVDILVNNAGVSGAAGKLLHEQSVADWDEVMNVNSRGIYLMLRGIVPLMLDNGGSVVNIASTGALSATSRNSGYYTSKGAVVQTTRAAAMDYVDRNIRVNAICPGVIETPMLGGAPAPMIEAIVSRIPMRRLGRPEEIAALTLFLASDEASFCTGSVFVADGGSNAGAV